MVHNAHLFKDFKVFYFNFWHVTLFSFTKKKYLIDISGYKRRPLVDLISITQEGIIGTFLGLGKRSLDFWFQIEKVLTIISDLGDQIIKIPS